MPVTYTETFKLVEDIRPHDCVEIGTLLYEVLKAESVGPDRIVLDLFLIATTKELGPQKSMHACLVLPTGTNIKTEK